MTRLAAAETALIARMAADLLRLEATGNESDAIRALFDRYAPLEIATHAGAALAQARALRKGAAA